MCFITFPIKYLVLCIGLMNTIWHDHYVFNLVFSARRYAYHLQLLRNNCPASVPGFLFFTRWHYKVKWVPFDLADSYRILCPRWAAVLVSDRQYCRNYWIPMCRLWFAPAYSAPFWIIYVYLHSGRAGRKIETASTLFGGGDTGSGWGRERREFLSRWRRLTNGTEFLMRFWNSWLVEDRSSVAALSSRPRISWLVGSTTALGDIMFASF